MGTQACTFALEIYFHISTSLEKNVTFLQIISVEMHIQHNIAAWEIQFWHCAENISNC